MYSNFYLYLILYVCTAKFCKIYQELKKKVVRSGRSPDVYAEAVRDMMRNKRDADRTETAGACNASSSERNRESGPHRRSASTRPRRRFPHALRSPLSRTLPAGHALCSQARSATHARKLTCCWVHLKTKNLLGLRSYVRVDRLHWGVQWFTHRYRVLLEALNPWCTYSQQVLLTLFLDTYPGIGRV